MIDFPSTSFLGDDVELAETFLTHFIRKVDNIRSQVQPDIHTISITHVNSWSLVHFEPVAIPILGSTVSHMSAPSCFQMNAEEIYPGSVALL